MLKVVFVRHGQQDYTEVLKRKYAGHGIDLAPLTERGIKMVEDVSLDSRLDNSELILSSPLTRTMQTAAIISKIRQLDIRVELDLQEWISNLSFQYSSEEEIMEAERLCTQYKGVRPDNCKIEFENFEDVFSRAKDVLFRYSNYKKIIVVSHSVVIRRFVSYPRLPLCGIAEIDFNESLLCTEFDYC
jgi:broad specificity phosphatase PhoE